MNKIIWSNYNIDIDDYADSLAEYLHDERNNLNIQLSDDIICIAIIGRWDGDRHGYKIIDSGNIKDCLYDNCDFCKWYIDNYNLCFLGEHHDGKNAYIYRAWKDGLTEEQKGNFLDALYYGKATSKTITKYTKSLKPYISKVYGW